MHVYGAMHAFRAMGMNANIMRIFRINLQIVNTSVYSFFKVIMDLLRHLFILCVDDISNDSAFYTDVIVHGVGWGLEI